MRFSHSRGRHGCTFGLARAAAPRASGPASADQPVGWASACPDLTDTPAPSESHADPSGRVRFFRLAHLKSSFGYNTTMSVIQSDPDILDGTPVFRGTRVPVQALIDYIEGGDTLDAFLDDFPTVSRDQVTEFLETAKNQSAACAE